MPSPLRLLAIYSTSEILGGGEISFTLSLQALARSGAEVLAAVTAPGPLAEKLARAGLRSEVLEQPPLREGGGWRHLFRPRADWLDLARRFRPHVIHCNAIRPALYAQAVGRALGVPAILHARKSEADPGVDPFLTLRLQGILCTSREVEKRFPRWLPGARREVLYNAVDTALFEAARGAGAELRARWRAGSDDLLVGVVGRLSTVKGHDLVVRAAPAVLREAPPARFVFIGREDPSEPGFERRLKDEIRALGMTEKFVFAGQIDDAPAAYHALDVVAFPTRSEGFGRVIVEAGAARRALVASDIAVLRELLSPALADLAVPCGAAEPLARRLIDLLARDALREAAAERLHAHVAARFGIEPHVRQLLAFYDKLLDGRRR